MERRGGWDLLGVTTGAFFVTMVARLVPSPLVPDIIDTFGVSTGTVGLALSGMWAAYALFQFPGGVIADRIGQRRVILLAMTGITVTSLLLSSSPNILVFAVAAVTLGSSAGLYFTAGTSFLADQFENTGRALGIHEIGASGAGLVAPVASAAVATRFGWRAGLLVPAVVAPIALVLFAWRVPETPPTNEEAGWGVDPHELFALLVRPGIAFTTLLAMISFFTWQSFASFFPTFLVEYVGLDTGRASLIFGVVFAITLVAAPSLGWVSDRVGRDRTLGASFVSGVVGYVLFLFGGGGLAAVIAGTGLVGLGLSWPGVLNSRFMDYLAADERGTGFGLVRTVVLLVSSLGSGVTGTLAGQVGWLAAYGLVGTLLAVLATSLVVNRVAGIDA
ncbi:MFS transporter [Haloplanus aerogenes]|uniref:MFS transporter n=1 Tax=Haloplanus aerogenes TaxID=660522 RepID=A0A3M0DWZ0_9EURY|nr:MFS transporter [Haloplanus aerogenes]AZH24260.1 MFS transporter [Haloplanus aerogenes]RMB24109.1 putative MFS family arabinose efflux permease [Haloplanus aerogenes]